MTYKVGQKGQVVLPKPVRERLGIQAGDEVTVEERDGEIRIRRAPEPVTLRGLLSDPTDEMPLTRLLELDHRWEIAHDEMRQAEWDMMRTPAADPELVPGKPAKAKKPRTPQPRSG